MKYILSQDELDALVPKQEKVERDDALELARKRILQLSQFKCPHEPGGHNQRCDGCPCLETKNEREEYEMNIGSGIALRLKHYLICNLPKSFSQ